jgi:hypothetical protein
VIRHERRETLGAGEIVNLISIQRLPIVAHQFYICEWDTWKSNIHGEEIPQHENFPFLSVMTDNKAEFSEHLFSECLPN